MSALLAQAGGFSGPAIPWYDISPLLVLLGAALTLLVVGALTPVWPRGLYALVAAVGAGAAGVLAGFVWDDVTDDGPRTVMRGALAIDHFGLFAWIAISAALLLSILVVEGDPWRTRHDSPDVHALYLLTALGGMVMAAADDLVVLFLGLEILSISLYVLSASNRRRAESQEAGLKYFVLGSFSSAIFLYGIALSYGATGSTGYGGIAATLASEVVLGSGDAILVAGLALLVVGLSFKVSAVPFHVWTPDVYQGAPSPVTGFMAAVGKIAAFAALLRVLLVALPSRADDWAPVIWFLALLTLLVGSVLAIVQGNVKRMLAYSSITHAGYVLVGVEAAGHVGNPQSSAGVSTALLYLMVYGVMVVGSFAVVAVVARGAGGSSDLGAFRGLSRRRPVLALAMTVLLLAQAGVPLTSGFIAKFGVIGAAVDVESYALAVTAMVLAVVGAYLYLRIVFAMWLTSPTDADAAPEPTGELRVPIATGVVILVAVAFTIVVGIFPDWLIEASRDAVQFAVSP